LIIKKYITTILKFNAGEVMMCSLPYFNVVLKERGIKYTKLEVVNLRLFLPVCRGY
jgi:hypothetical protein